MDMNESTNSRFTGSVSSIEGIRTISPLMLQRRRVLLIDDDVEFAELLGEVLEDDFDVFVDCAPDIFAALKKMHENSYDAVILDWYLPKSVSRHERIEVALTVDSEEPVTWKLGQLPVIVLSSHDREILEFVESEYFRLSGFVSKKQSLQGILDDLKSSLDEIFEMELSA